jgi:hypothetical protein
LAPWSMGRILLQKVSDGKLRTLLAGVFLHLRHLNFLGLLQSDCPARDIRDSLLGEDLAPGLFRGRFQNRWERLQALASRPSNIRELQNVVERP